MTFTEHTFTTMGGREIDVDIADDGTIIDAYISGDQRDNHTMICLFPNQSERNPLFWHANRPDKVYAWLRNHAVNFERDNEN